MNDSKQEFDYPGLILVFGLYLLAALYLKSTNWTTNLDLVTVGLIIGFGFGYLLGRSKFDRIAVFWLTLSFTLVILFLLLFLVTDSSLTLINHLFFIFYQVGISIQEYSSGAEISSPLIILLIFTIIFWLGGLFSAYTYTRYRNFVVSMILIVFIFILLEYFLPEKERNSWVTGIAAITGLLLVVYKTSMDQTETRKINGSTDRQKLRWTIRPGLVLASVVIVITAWSIPLAVRAASAGTPESQRFNHFSYQLQDNFARLTASLRGSARSTAISFGPSLPLGIKAASEESIVFTVTASEELPADNRIYWRSKAYEIYEDGTWQEGEQKQVQLEGGAQLLQPAEVPNETTLTYRVKANSSLGDYFYPGEFVSINNPANLIYTPRNDGEKDIIAVEPVNTVLSGFGYRVDVLFSPKSVEELADAQGEIPDWVETRYLQIPEAIKPGIQALAERITVDSTTSYEKAVAITEFLRSNYRYSEVVNIPANDRDRIEWFLFEGGEGFCNYFASAEVILLRAIGIPARLVVGFSEGEVSGEGTIFTVKARNRHAWPEVYFPGEGWVIFEPTPSLPEIQFSSAENLPSSELPASIPDEPLGLPPREDDNISPENGFPEAVKTISENDPQHGRGYDPIPALLLVIGLVVGTPMILFERTDRQTKIRLLRIIRTKLLMFPIHISPFLENSLLRWQTPEIETVYNDTVQLGSFLFGINPGNKTPAEFIHELIARCPWITLEAKALLMDYQNWVYGGKETDDRRAQALRWKIQIKMIKSKITEIIHFHIHSGSGE